MEPWVTGFLGGLRFFSFARIFLCFLSDSSHSSSTLLGEQGSTLPCCLHNLPLFTHDCQHTPCCIASSQPGVDERASQRSSRTGHSIDAALLRQVGHPLCLLLRTAASRQVIAGDRKAWFAEPHTYLSCPAPCGVVRPLLSRSSLAASSSAPGDLGG